MAANFAPLWLAGGLAAAAYGLLFARRGRRALLAPGVVVAGLAAILIAPEFARPIPSSPASKRTLRLIEFNTWDRNADVPATADWIAAQAPDVVVVVEAEEPIRSALRTRGFILSRGFGHVAVYSRAATIPQPAPLAPGEWKAMPPFARATLQDARGRFTVIGVHVPEPTVATSPPERLMLARMVGRYDPARVILAGDFNLTPWSFALRDLDRRLGLVRLDRAVWSWPACLQLAGTEVRSAPFLPIDHVYAGSGWRLVGLRRGPSLGSDHYPLVVDLSDEP